MITVTSSENVLPDLVERFNKSTNILSFKKYGMSYGSEKLLSDDLTGLDELIVSTNLVSKPLLLLEVSDNSGILPTIPVMCYGVKHGKSFYPNIVFRTIDKDEAEILKSNRVSGYFYMREFYDLLEYSYRIYSRLYGINLPIMMLSLYGSTVRLPSVLVGGIAGVSLKDNISLIDIISEVATIKSRLMINISIDDLPTIYQDIPSKRNSARSSIELYKSRPSDYKELLKPYLDKTIVSKYKDILVDKKDEKVDYYGSNYIKKYGL